MKRLGRKILAEVKFAVGDGLNFYWITLFLALLVVANGVALYSRSNFEPVKISPREILVVKDGEEKQFLKLLLSNQSNRLIRVAGARLGCFKSGWCVSTDDTFPMQIEPQETVTHAIGILARADCDPTFEYEIYIESDRLWVMKVGMTAAWRDSATSLISQPSDKNFTARRRPASKDSAVPGGLMLDSRHK